MLILFFSVFGILILSSCSLDASLTELSLIDANPGEKLQRDEVDFVSGEIVTTTNGVVVKGTFGEVSDKQVLSNGATIEGAFYE
ncbi:hypothetical protein D3C87_162310 [compost metagenome]